MKSYVPDYDLVEPRDLSAVLQLLASDEGCRPIAGGTDLMVLFNSGKLPYQRLVSIRSLPELCAIRVDESHVEIGAAATYTDLRNHTLLQNEFPLLCQAAAWTGSIANQNRGTIGGNIANASPAADSAPALLVYDAELQLRSQTSSRSVPYAEFHTGYKQMRMRSDELITAIRLKRPTTPLQHYGRKVGTRKAQAISKVCFIAVAAKDEHGRLATRIALGSVAPVPIRCTLTEQALRGEIVTRSVVRKACETILRDIHPITDIRSTSDYRAQVTVNLLADFLSTLS